MKEERQVVFEDTTTGKIFTHSFAVSINMLMKIHKGELKILRFQKITYPETLSEYELALVLADEAGESIPSTMQDALAKAKVKVNELRTKAVERQPLTT
jgi:hypothetical protein